MNRRTVLIAIALFAVLAVLAVVLSRQPEVPDATVAETEGEVEAPPIEAVVPGEGLTVNLYFPGTAGALVAERRELVANTDLSLRVQSAVEALLLGPTGPRTLAPLPAGVSVRKVYLREGGVVFLDLESPEGAPPPASGSSSEMLAVYSLVNTVLLNFEGLERMVLLWNGRQLKTFAGHMDTMRPLAANPSLIARAP